MVAYALFIRDRMRDPETMKTYYEKLPASLEGHPVVRRVNHGALEALEGSAPESVVMLEFPDIAAARAWYDSLAYREARPFRHLSADYRSFIVEGL